MKEERGMAKFETVALVEPKRRLPAQLMPLVEEYKDKPKGQAGAAKKRGRPRKAQ